MRLKSLELKGFKSFANETVIHFDQDVIGVVGPNGSGKSNIVDAIRWVLGEQKGKELRLENMGDVLFNGTKKRKAGGVASVSITFENTKNILPTEYQSVKITRMLYRSGESEYRLNGVTCRLKDIRSLLMDTGIGSNSYAIIALGMVDDILHNKENARRRMFEQAAGVAKYKRRKHETLLKLKSTTADLDRVEDLLFEIEGNLKTLEQQARRTKRFVDIKDKYKEQSIQLSIRKTDHLNHRYRDLTKQIETEKDVLGQHQADLAKKEAQLQNIKKGSLDEEKAVGDQQRELNVLVGTIRSMESEKGLKEQEMVFLQQSAKKLGEQVASNTVRLAELKEAITRKTRDLQVASKDTGTLKMDLEEKRTAKEEIEAAYTSVKSRRDAFGSTQQEVEDGYIELEKSFASQGTDIARISQQLGRYSSELDEMEVELNVKTDELKTLKAQLDLLRKDLAAQQQNETERKNQLEEQEQKRDQVRARMQKALRSFDAKQHERDLLKDMIQKLEGFPESVKYLSKSKKWAVKAPLLSDVIYCTPEHRVKVEYLLRGYLNDYVVDTVEEAAEAIQLLAAAQKGKANFFVLNRIGDTRKKTPKVSDATPLIDFIQYDKKYQLLVEHLLGDAFITEGSPTDPQYQTSKFRDCTLVDSQGQVFVQSSSVSGGSVGLFEGKKLGRAKNLEVLNKEIEGLEKEVRSLESELETIELQLQLLRSGEGDVETEELRQAVNRCEQSVGERTVIVDRLKSGQVQTTRRIEEETAALEAIKKQMAETRSSLHVMKLRMESDASQWKDADAEYGAMMSAFSKANADFNQAHLAFVQKSNEVENLEREIRFQNHQIEELQTQIANDKQQITSDFETIGEIQKLVERLESELIDHYAAKKGKESELTTAEQQYFEARNEIHELEERIRSISREFQNSQYLVNQLKDEHNDIRFKLASVSERLQIEFNVKLEDILTEEVDRSLDLEELEIKVEKLRGRIENYGEINPMAVEAHDEMQQRFDIINSQKIDILDAKDSLMETIKEIEQTATEKFVDAFSKVREYFIDVFRSLFTEDDSCDLILADPTKPLDTDILIIAKPKGKRPKSLSQLSGGEKTLTATALLFALYLLKPAPFCVFDEVDAPLDDANILKFNKIVKKFAEQSQFIIVTHNKQTMATVDVIYGVYMEEQGVSSLSPVDFRHLDHEAILETVEG